MGLIQPDSDGSKRLYVGGGRFYIALRKPDNTYEPHQYLGKTSGASISIEVETLEHKQSERMPVTKDKEILTSMSGTMSVTVDEIAVAILGLFFLGETTTKTQSAGNIDISLDVQNGFVYFLNKYKISSLEVKNADDSVTFVENVDYTINKKMGSLTILKEGNIGDETLHITGDYDTFEYTTMEGMTKPKVEAKVIFEEDAVTGEEKIWTFHSVQIVANGDYAMKSTEDFATVNFDFKLQEDPTIQGEGISKILKIDSMGAV